MNKLILVLLLLASLFSQAETKINIEEHFKPAKLQSIDWHQENNFQTYVKALGKASLQEGNKFYYEIKGLKYPLSLHKKEKSEKIEKIYHRIIGEKISFEQLKDYLQKNNFVKDPTSKIEDNYQSFISNDKKIKLQFSKATQELYAVEKWF
jgi:hypothetical protein